MYTKAMLNSARLSYLRLSQIFDEQPTEFPTDESFMTFYSIILMKLGMDRKDETAK